MKKILLCTALFSFYATPTQAMEDKDASTSIVPPKQITIKFNEKENIWKTFYRNNGSDLRSRRNIVFSQGAFLDVVKGPIRTLRIKGCQLSKFGKDEIKILAQADVKNLRLTGLPPLEKLKELFTEDCPDSEDLSFHHLQQLQIENVLPYDRVSFILQSPLFQNVLQLGLNCCFIHPDILAAITRRVGLTHLDITHCNETIGDEQAKSIVESVSLKSLVHMNLSLNHITCEGLKVILQGKLPNLQYLNLSQTNICEYKIDEEYFGLPGEDLTHLILSSNNMSMELFKHVFQNKLPNLQYLDISRNQIEQFDLSLENLTHLDLSSNPITSEGFMGLASHIKNLGKLTFLDIRGILNLKSGDQQTNKVALQAISDMRKQLPKLQILFRTFPGSIIGGP
ncbi:MAG: hypothetical protein BGO67_02290 [Alphaproteobacteria bacterium 41-28]|nr:MAG: hypothetical protein BGO67_02290 [Alphaproteobacteria bacterium 41-28]